jgi:hypothetical protein
MLGELGTIVASPQWVDGIASGIPETPVIESALAWPTLYPFPIPKGIDPAPITFGQPSPRLSPLPFNPVQWGWVNAPASFTM